MGFRRFTFLLAITFAMSLAACGDNKKPVFDDAGVDMSIVDGDMDDAPPDAGCPVGQTLCGTDCVDVKTDDDHCGDCDTDCGTGTCQTHNGMTTCCASGLTNCDGTCVDLTTDPDHCGTCQTDCGTNECKTNGGSSICCPANQINCNGQCVDPMSDEAACGGCIGDGGVACTGLTDTCCNGACVNVDLDDGNCGMCGTMCTSGSTTCHAPGTGSTAGTDSVCCAAGETNCDGACVSLVLSDANCGGCGIGCTAPNTHCQSPDVGATPQCCLDAENNCNGTCSDPNTDNNNCGGCSGLGGTGQQCNGSDSCKSGLCCGPQELTCGGQCVDPDTNPNHCGGCAGVGGVACSGATPVCSDGECVSGCDVSETACGNACVTTSSDPNNCGSCGNKCGSTEVCNGGTCVPTTTGCTGGKVLCDGACVDPMTDEDHCGGCPGTTCDATDTCDGGICCDAGTVNTNGICCPTGWLACDVGGGTLQCKNPADDATCGTCQNNCGTGSCTNGTGGFLCCDADETRCGSTCVDLDADNGNCGMCGVTCTTPDTCTPTVGTGDAQCCDTAGNELNCDGACINKLTDPDNCGACDSDCGGTNICSNGHCCALGETSYTVGGNTKCCPAGQFSCDGMTCIDGTSGTACGTACGALANCSQNGQLCDSSTHSCIANCGTLTTCFGTQCIDTDNDPNNCGGCGSTFACPAEGQACVGGVCQDCPVGPAAGCPSPSGNVCVDTQNNDQNCGACGSPCELDETCQAGHCCATGTTWCAAANACVDTQTSNTNCGACGNACGAGETCQSGSCDCSFGQKQFPGPVGNCSADTCYTSTVDPKHCGLSCEDCTTGPGNANRVCVNGSCQSSCPAPLSNCPAAAGDPFNFRHCVNTSTDNLNCGSCGFKCPAGQGCSNGGCVPLVLNPVPTTPAKCVGGGPPISVPTGGGSQTCTGNLGSVSFLFGLCSRTSIGPISRDILTDAFHSNLGGYKSSCDASLATADARDATCVPFKRCTISGEICTGSGQGDCDAGNQCVYPIKCVATTPGGSVGKCVGGGIGVNGRTTMGTYVTAISNTGATSVGGDFWTFGTVGLQVKGTTTVYLDHKNGPSADANTDPLAQNGPIDLTSKSMAVYGNSEVKGAWVSNMNGEYTVQGILKTAASCTGGKPIPQVSSPNPIQCQQPFTNYGEPCGKFDGTDGSLIPIAQTIVPYFKDPTHNDNALIGLKYNALDGKSGHLDLPCGIYYLNTINTNATTTIYVRGRVALIVGGSIRLAQPIAFDLDPGSSLDIFVGGVLDMSQNATLGSPAYPARTRLYFGSAKCAGSGEACKGAADCCGGLCSTCPVDADGKPTAPCSGLTGTCTTGSSGLDKAVSLSSGGNFNGLIWAGYGTFTHQSPLEMYGSIYTGFFDASGVTTIHYDKAATELGDECPPIPPGSACESARDCDTGQACVGNTCGSCTQDSQCIPPGRCVGGSCTF